MVLVNDERVLQVLTRLGYDNQVTAVAVTFLLPLIIVAGYYATLPKPKLWWWLGMMLIAASYTALHRWLTSRRLAANAIDTPFALAWRRHYWVQTVLIGFGWGNLGMLFVPGAFIQNAALMVIFLGVGAGASNTAGMHHLAGMYAGTVTGIFLQAFHLPKGFGEHAMPMQFILMLYLGVLLLIGRNVNRLVRDSILLRFENEEILRQKTMEAARADRANHDKSMFLASASHDMRQPVHALLLLVTALRQRVTDVAQLDLITHIQKAGRAIGDLFNALMELSCLESGSEKVQMSDVFVHELVLQAVERHQPQARLKGLDLAAAAHVSFEYAALRTDGVLIGRILDNLISNAIRYTVRGRVLVAMRWRRPDTLWLEVWDTGIGIAPENAACIFEPYFQVENRERDRSKGLGLGLAIVRRTADLLGYRLDLCSVPGRGTRFRLTMDGVDLVPWRRLTVGAPESAALDLSGRRLLVIDDDPMVLEAMRLLLTSWGGAVKLARDGDECRTLLWRDDWVPDCVLCDYRLPGSDNGMDLLNMLVDRYPDTVPILQTGELDPGLRAMAEDAGYIVLTKPVAPDLLASTLSAVLRD